MSDVFSLEVGSFDKAEISNGYTVKLLHGCRLVFGFIPVTEIKMLCFGFSDRAVMDSALADRIGASLVVGEPEDIEQLRDMNLPISERRESDAQAAISKGLPEALIQWLRYGARGHSSEAMSRRIFGIPATPKSEFERHAHPRDSGDLGRCVSFLDQVEAHDKVEMMCGASPQWTSLVEAWSDLVDVFRRERKVGSDFFEQTNALMRSTLSAAELKASGSQAVRGRLRGSHF